MDGWVFLVLTLDRGGYYSGERPWADTGAAYADLSRLSRNFLARLNRWQVRRGWTETGSRWVSTVEAHRSGWPHVNFLIYSPELARELEVDRAAREQSGERGRDLVLLRGELLDLATRPLEGAKVTQQRQMWGVQSTAEAARHHGSVASYIVKLAELAGDTSGELAKLTQAPMNAPARFRRLRAGKGFLPPRHRDPAITGTMVKRTYDTNGYPVVRAVSIDRAYKNLETRHTAHVQELLAAQQIGDLEGAHKARDGLARHDADRMVLDERDKLGATAVGHELTIWATEEQTAKQRRTLARAGAGAVADELAAPIISRWAG